LDRSKVLAARQLIPRSDFDAATVALAEANADAESAVAVRLQAQAAVDQARVNLAHAVIVSPVDGIVVARMVDVGQTVAASFQTPSLFSIAADLAKMQIKATVDEADIGKVLVGQGVRFLVDAYPSEPFEGKVVQVRLQPETVQNVVTYDTMIAVDNSKLLLKPGMTATVAIEVARHTSVPRVPGAALRFRPTQAVLAALEEPDVVSTTKVATAMALTPGTVGEVWVTSAGRLEPRRVRVGLSDGQSVELTEGPPVGAQVVTSAVLEAAVHSVLKPAASPVAPAPTGPRR
jgi:HlyD family secretion protein